MYSKRFHSDRPLVPSTELSRMMPANDRGEYVVSELPPGAYNVMVEKPGFRTRS